MPFLLPLPNGPIVSQQISRSCKNAVNKDYEVLILGNSRTYRGLNPDMFALSTINFSHDNDSYNQIFYKLCYTLENNKSFDYLILGVDYFQFSFISGSRNYAYGDFLGDAYLKDYDNRNVLLLKAQYYLGNANPKKLLLLFPLKSKPFLRDNGQFIMPGVATENDWIKRDINRLVFQEDYFKKTIDLCKTRNIKVFIVLPPTRPKELELYSKDQIDEFDAYINKFVDNLNVYYLNYSIANNFQTKDYADITHLNEAAADVFSKILSNDMAKLIDE